MSRGRHRHSSVLGRVFPPTAAGVLLVAALAALLFSQDTILVRSVGVAAVIATLGFALLLRQRDRAARAAAEMSAAQRLRAEERFEEQLAEAEYAAEVAEERATRFGRRLTAEKSRLAKAETEIARLLRERAVTVAEQALKEAEAAQRALAASRPKYPASPAAYVRAAAVLRLLERRAAEQEAQRARTAGAEVVLRAPAKESLAGKAAPAVPAPAPVAVPALVDALGASATAAPHATTYLRISVLGIPAMLIVLAATGVLRGLQDTRTPLYVAIGGFTTNVA
ncbi:MATE family efflux transporter, partial [Kitasatospora sp. NPDC057542]|uniref:MATE family efflux transporter n=1 Tax=Kitasatospora sp. NPDC057542 TaxID=3346162 RepID=UPI00369E6E1D